MHKHDKHDRNSLKEEIGLFGISSGASQVRKTKKCISFLVMILLDLKDGGYFFCAENHRSNFDNILDKEIVIC